MRNCSSLTFPVFFGSGESDETGRERRVRRNRTGAGRNQNRRWRDGKLPYFYWFYFRILDRATTVVNCWRGQLPILIFLIFILIPNSNISLLADLNSQSHSHNCWKIFVISFHTFISINTYSSLKETWKITPTEISPLIHNQQLLSLTFTRVI